MNSPGGRLTCTDPTRRRQMDTVSFTRMEDGTAEDYALLDSFEEEFMKGLPGRLLRALDGLKGSFDGYQVTRYDHSLQAATRAHRDGRDEEYVVTTLLHDIGDELAPLTHGEMVAAILRPYVREEIGRASCRERG